MDSKVTAVITTFCRNAEVVKKAILSIKQQTYKNIEIIVIDDNINGSYYSADVKKLCEECDVNYIKQNGNQGACAARNLGICNSSGDYIAFLDDDDLWLPNKIETQLSLFQANPSAGMVFCNGFLHRIDINKDDEDYNKQIKTEVTMGELLAGDCIGSTSHPLIKKEVFEKVGGFWEKQPARQDYEMWIRISQHYSIIGTRERLFIHNIHSGEQISKSSKKSYWGYRNIYCRYKRFYFKNKDAKQYIVNCIYSNIYNISFFNLYIFFAKSILWIKNKMSKDKETRNY